MIAENLHRNYIDHAEYPQTAEIEQRCIRMMADLFNAPGETTGTRTQGSSEAIMLGALSLKWKWRERREQAGKPTDRPNLVFGGDVHVVWEKFCRYFDVEPRIIPLQPDKLTIGPEDVEPHVDENTIGVAAVLGTTFTGHADDIRGINDCCSSVKESTGLDIPLHVDAASGGFVWPFLYPDTRVGLPPRAGALDQRLRATSTGSSTPASAGSCSASRSDLPEDLVFYENYLGKRDATFTLNFSTGRGDGAGAVLQLRPLRPRGLPHDHGDDAAQRAAARAATSSRRRTSSSSASTHVEQLPLVAFKLAGERDYDEFDVASQLAAERGWMVPAYTLPPNADHVTILRVLVKETLGQPLVGTLAEDIAQALRDARSEGRTARARPPAGEDRHRLLTVTKLPTGRLHHLAILRWLCGSGRQGGWVHDREG